MAKATGSVCQKFEKLRAHSTVQLFSVLKNDHQFHAYLTNHHPYKLNKLTVQFPMGTEYAKIFSFEISKRNALTQLGISNNNMGPDGIKVLAPEIGKLTALSQLGLNGNNMGDFGFGYIIGKIENFKFFKILYVQRNPLSDHAKQFISNNFNILF